MNATKGSALALLSLLLLASASSAKSPRPQPQQRAHTQTPTQQDNRVASPAPTAHVEPSPTVTPEHRGTYTYNYYYESKDRGDWSGWAQAVFTLGLVIFAAWQMRFVRRATTATEQAANAARDNATASKNSADAAKATVDAMTKTADAAKKSADAAEAALHINRPYIVIQDVSFTMTSGDVQVPAASRSLPPRPVSLTIMYQNFGTGPANLIEVYVDSELFPPPWPEPQLSALRLDHPMGRQPLSRPVVGANATDKVECWNPPAKDTSLFNQIDGKTRCLAVYGFIKYRGAPTREYTTRFLWWNRDAGDQFFQGVSEELNARD